MTQKLFGFSLSFAFLFLVFLDQVTKFFFPTSYLNTGISFGLQPDLSTWFFIILLAIVIFSFQIFFENRSFTFELFKAIFFAGAISNLIDRVFLNGVRDWWSFPVLGFTNNLADVWITVGVLGIIWVEVLEFKKKKTND
jgi:lipoprotein signal peptidase